MSVARFDNGSIESTALFTEEGYLFCDAIVTRTGVFIYRNADGSMRRELRHPDDVLQSDSLETMKLIPVTNDHPPERLVDPGNAQRLSVGYTGESIKPDGRFIYVNFKVTDQNAIEQISLMGKKELSLGYTVDLIEEAGIFDGEEYDFRQTNIKYNHLSIVQSARAGSEARIALDANDAVEISHDEEAKMAQRKVKIDQDEFLVEPEAAESIERLVDDMKNLKAEKDRIESELKMIEEKMEKSMGERDAAMSEAESLLKLNGELKEEKNDTSEINRLVRARIRLIKQAESVLDSESIEKLDDTSDLEIKKLVVKAKCPNANLDGKSDIYIGARFDAVVEDLPKNQVVVNTATTAETKQDQSTSKANDARSRMIEKMTNNYKREGGR